MRGTRGWKDACINSNAAIFEGVCMQCRRSRCRRLACDVIWCVRGPGHGQQPQGSQQQQQSAHVQAGSACPRRPSQICIRGGEGGVKGC